MGKVEGNPGVTARAVVTTDAEPFPPNAPPRVARITRVLITLAVMAIATAWVARFVHRRLTIMPPTLEQAYAIHGPIESSPDSGPDVTDELIPVIQQLTIIPVFNLPAPTGMHWEGDISGSLELDEARRGGWNPKERPYLQACVEYFRDPKTVDAIAQLRRLTGGSFRTQSWDNVLLLTEPAIDLFDLRYVTNIVAAFARYQYAELGDTSGAVDTLIADLWLAESSLNDELATRLILWRQMERYALDEIQYLCCEADLTASDANRLATLLDDMQDPRIHWPRMKENESRMFLTCLQTRYARTADGDGWLVLSASSQYLWSSTGTIAVPPQQTSSWWNVLSLPHNDFTTVAAKYRAMLDAVPTPLPDNLVLLRQQLGQRANHVPMISSLDLPARFLQGIQTDLGWYELDCAKIYHAMTHRDLTRLVIALTRYRAEHSEYPATLQALIPEYMANLPVTALTGKPFEYALDADGCFQVIGREPQFDREQGGRSGDHLLTCCQDSESSRHEPQRSARLVPDDGSSRSGH